MKIEEIIIVLAREALEALVRAWFDQDSVKKKGSSQRPPKGKSKRPPGKQ